MADNEMLVQAPGRFVPRAAISFGGDGATATAVDDGHPLPIASGAPASMVAGIAAGASLSAAIDLAAQRLHRIAVPAGWTSAAISFQASADGATWADLYDGSGEIALPVTSIAAGRAVVVDAGAFLGVRWLKVRSGVAAAPVVQPGQRDLMLVTVAR